MCKLTKSEVDLDRKYHFKKESGIEFGLGGIRLQDKKHVKNIKSDIRNGRAKYMSPIEVNVNTMEVIDGCNRFKAITELWEEGFDCELTVLFYDIPTEEQRDTVVIKNTTSKNWGKTDFVKMYYEEDNPSVVKLVDFCRTHDKCHGKFNKKGECKTRERYGMAFLKGTNVTREMLKTLKQTVKITDEDVEFANEIHPEVMKIYELCGYTTTGTWFENFIQGWYQFRSDWKKLKKMDSIGGIDKYMERLKTMINNGYFNREQVQSKAVWYDRFSGVLDADPVSINVA